MYLALTSLYVVVGPHSVFFRAVQFAHQSYLRFLDGHRVLRGNR